MKIKDGIVISKSDLEEWKQKIKPNITNFAHINVLLAESIIEIIDKIISESKPLEPIICDAWKCEDSTLDDYINETTL